MDEKPDLSVIIASYNPGNLLRECLDSLGNQKTGKTFEIIVVDSSMEEMAYRMEEGFPKVRWYHFQERKFCGEARNVGLSVARANILAFIDADCRAETNWVDKILQAHRSPSLAIGGAIANGNPESMMGWAAYFSEFSQWMPGSRSRNTTDIPGANMSYKRTALEEYGPFIEGTYSSDTDFHWRLGDHGHPLLFTPSIVVHHHNIDRTGRFLGHEFDHGRSFARVRVTSRGFSPAMRSIYVIFSFLLPLWLLIKIGLRNLKNRIYVYHFAKVFPLLMLGVLSWSLGEVVGYLQGPLPGNQGASSAKG